MVLKGGFKDIFALQNFKVKLSQKGGGVIVMKTKCFKNSLLTLVLHNNVVVLADSPENGRSQQKLLLFSSPELMESYCGRLLPVDV